MTRPSAFVFAAILATVLSTPVAMGVQGPKFSAPQPLPGDLGVISSSGNQRNAAIARGSGGYLAVWEDDRAEFAGAVQRPNGILWDTDVYGMLLDDQGAPLSSAPFVIAQNPGFEEEPDVAWNGQEYLVVWEWSETSTWTSNYGVYAARVTASGQVLDDPPLLIDDQPFVQERFPEVASNGTTWLVSYRDEDSFGFAELHGNVVESTGSIGPAKTLIDSSSDPDPLNFDLGYCNSRYLIAYHSYLWGRIIGQRFDGVGSLVGGLFTIYAASAVEPEIASNGTDFFVSWHAGGVRGTPMPGIGGAPAVPGGALLTPGLPAVTEHGVAWDGTRWVLVATAAADIVASRVSTTGALAAGSPFVISTSLPIAGSVTEATAAGGAGQVVGLWTDRRDGHANWVHAWDRDDVFSARIDSSGAGAAQCVSVSARAQHTASVDGDEFTGYLVAFISQSSGRAQIVCQRLSPTGAVLDPEPIVLDTGTPQLHWTDVAWNGSEWLVVWTQMDSVSPFPLRSVYARRVRPDGSLPDPTRIFVNQGNTPRAAPAGGTFLIASEWDYPPAVGNNPQIRARRLRGSDGALLDPTELVLDFGAGTPAVVGFDDRWLVAWGNIRAGFVLSSGQVMPPFFAAIGNTAQELDFARQGSSDVAMLVWRNGATTPWVGDVVGRRIRKDGTLLNALSGETIASALRGQFRPRVAWTGLEYFVAFNDHRVESNLRINARGDVYGGRVDANATALDGSGVPIVAADPRPEGTPAVSGGGHRVVLASTVLESGTYGSCRIMLQWSSGEPSSYCVAKTTVAGCQATIASTGTPTATGAGPFDVTASEVQNQKSGILLYGTNGPAALPFLGGTLCLMLPLRRTAVLQQSGGSPLPTANCTGAFLFNFQALIASGTNPALAVGASVRAQYWFRDQGTGAALSNGLSFVIRP